MPKHCFIGWVTLFLGIAVKTKQDLINYLHLLIELHLFRAKAFTHEHTHTHTSSYSTKN